MGDIFDDVLNIGDGYIKEGIAEGLEAGKKTAGETAKSLGVQKGWEIGAELGEIRGAVCAWLLLNEKHPALFSTSAKKVLHSLESLLDDTLEPSATDDAFFEKLDKIRGKRRQLQSLIGTGSNSTNPSSGETGLAF